MKRGLLIILLLPAVFASECDNPDSNWLICEDFEDYAGDFTQWYEATDWYSSERDDRGRIDISTNAFDGEYALYMPAAASSGYMGANLRWYDCVGNHVRPCDLNGHEQLYLRAYLKLAPDHEMVHHFLNIGGSQLESEVFWDSMGLAGCRPNGVISAGTTVDFNEDHESHFYTYSIDMSCNYNYNCCDECASKGLPCVGDTYCCWGDHYPENPGPDSVLPKDEWVCMEMTMQLNTPNVHDGYMAYWLDNELIHEQNNMYWRIDPGLQLARIGIQHYIDSGEADQSNRIWWDNVILSEERIGCYQSCDDPTIHCVDDTAGATQEYSDIQLAIDAAGPGDTVLIYDGTYQLSSALRVRSGPLTIKSVNQYGARIIAPTTNSNIPQAMFVCNWDSGHCTDTDFDLVVDGIDISGGYTYTIQITTATDVVIKNSKIHGPGREGFKINGDEGHSNRVVVEDCEIYDTGLRDPSNAEGLDITSSYNITVRNNHVHDIATCGMYAKKDSRDILFENNLIEDADCGIGLGQSSACTDCTARNNVIINTDNMGIQARGSTRGKMYHNTMINVARVGAAAVWIARDDYDNVTEGLEVYNNIVLMDSVLPVMQAGTDTVPSIDDIVSNNNIWYNAQGVKFRIFSTDRDFSQWQTFSGEDSASYTDDPGLEQTFHLSSGSPAVDRGVDVGMNTDYYGNARPNGNGFDIGAFESGYSSQVPLCGSADANTDGSITNSELLSYINNWKTGAVNIVNCLDAIGKWKSGC